MKSPRFSFSGTGKSILISLGLSLLTAFATWLSTVTEQFDFGVYAPLVGALAVWMVNIIREFVFSKK